MQRFELVAGASAKFWEVERVDVSVTVRFGRLGSAGQAQQKAFATVAEAEAHRARLVAAKTQKGYRPVSSMAIAPAPVPAHATTDTARPGPPAVAPARSTTDTAPGPAAPAPVGAGPADEDVLVLPDAWRLAAWPRRDRGSPAVTPLPPGLERELLRRHGDALVARLNNTTTGPDVRRAGLAYLENRLSGDDGDPFGAAVLLSALCLLIPYSDHATLAPLADDWVARAGYGFAASAMAEAGGLELVGESSVRDDTPGVARLSPAPPFAHCLPPWFAVAVRLRALLATAPGEGHAAAVGALGGYRNGSLDRQRALTSFLVPDQNDWVAADCAGPASPDGFVVGRLLGAAAHTAGQVEALADAGRLLDAASDLPLLATLVTGVGAGLAPVLHDWVDESYFGVEGIRRLLAAIALLPSDGAFRALLTVADRKYTQPALLDAVKRFPYRALRLLAEAPAGNGAAAALLRVHVLSNPGVAQRAWPGLPAAAAGRVRSIVDGATAVAVAADDALPPVLREPPWTRRRAVPKPVVVTGLTVPAEAAMAWEPGEREAFRARRHETEDFAATQPGNYTWASLAAHAFGAGGVDLNIMVHAPDEVTRPRLAGWVPADRYGLDAAAPALAARYGLDVLPALLALADRARSPVLPALLPYACGAVALRVPGWLGRKSTRAPAAAWLTRHPEVAARALVPVAVGRPGPARRGAERALRFVAGSGRPDAVTTAAAAHGRKTADAVAVLLDADPLDVLPATRPEVPVWLDPALLPQIPLRNGAGALPPEAVRSVCVMFAMSTIAEPYAGTGPVVDACELRGFWWEAFLRWQQVGYPPAAGWVLQALGLVGDDDTVRRLAPLIRAWPGEGGHARAVAALDVLAAIGTDVALIHLHGIATKVKFTGLRDRAQEKIEEVAEGLGLTAEQLADRLVPDFGLDVDGGMVLGFGPRTFTVGFDEHLRPYVLDGAGTRRPSLPKPGAKDDPESAHLAGQRFAALKKDVRTASDSQIRRLERAMVSGREWTGAGFRVLFVAHPLLVHLVRRLVWTADGRAFRVAEDRTFADVDDNAFPLADDARVSLAHPLALDTGPWAEVFADYEILQPFPQLARPTYALTRAEEAGTRLTRWAGLEVPATVLLGLERRGWRRGAPQDGGVQSWFERPLGELTAVVDVDPGIVVGDPGMLGDQSIPRVWLKRPTDPFWAQHRDGAPFSHISRVAASEILYDLTEVTA